MSLILLSVISVIIFFQIIIIGIGVYFILDKIKILNIKIKAPIIEVPIENKKIVRHSYDSIYVSNSLKETPIKHSDGDLIPYGLNDSDKALLEMFYDKD